MSLFIINIEIIVMMKELFLFLIFLEFGCVMNIIIISSFNLIGDVCFLFICGFIVMWIVSLLFFYVFGIFVGFGFVGVWFVYIIDEGV